MSAMGHPTPMSARFLGTGNQPTEANNLSSDALAALVSERLRATRVSAVCAAFESRRALCRELPRLELAPFHKLP